MGILTNIIGIVASGGATLGARAVSIAVGAGIIIAMSGGAYIYVHDKNLALAAAKADLALARAQLGAAVAANGADLQMIDALRSQQLQAEAAQMAMNTRDQISRDSAAAIQSLIDRDAVTCAGALPAPDIAKAVAPINRDSAVAPVLNDALMALAAAQTAKGATP